MFLIKGNIGMIIIFFFFGVLKQTVALALALLVVVFVLGPRVGPYSLLRVAVPLQAFNSTKKGTIGFRASGLGFRV